MERVQKGLDYVIPPSSRPQSSFGSREKQSWINSYFPQAVADSLKKLGPTKVTIPYYTPKNMRQMTPTDEIAIPRMRRRFKSFLTQSFGGVVSQEEISKVAEYGVDFTYWYYPTGPIDSPQYFAVTKMCGILFILDDLFDVKDANAEEGHHKSGHASVMRLLLDKWHKSNGETDTPEISVELEQSLKEVPLLACICVALRDTLKSLDRLGGREPARKMYEYYMFRAYFAESLRHSRVYSVNPDAARFFTGEQLAMTAVIGLFAWGDGIRLSEKFKMHPLFVRYQDMAKMVGVMQNDMVGLERDLVNGEINHVITQMTAGKTLDEVLAREIKLHEQDVEEHLVLREEIMAQFKDDEEVVKYLEITDATLYGQLKMMDKCTRNSMMGRLDFVVGEE
ncbi:hypothetical protein Fcan01_15764 [Folsomia candida]|uniref:Terpene synthase n=1 Tax=Folsomia candida TaxID=158441 RepID=A0A226DVC0_FOLCA|nr:hypothetical protein Fcan01_15764 [Folsomia candida]